MTTKIKRRTKKLPALGWCNIVVSRLDVLPTQRAMGFVPFRTSSYGHGKIRRPGDKWFHCEMNYGDNINHPLDLPKRFVYTLWTNRDLWEPWDDQKLPSRAIHGVVLHTKMLAVLDLLWAIKYSQEAYRKLPKKSPKRVDIIKRLASLFPQPLIPTTVTSESFARMLLGKTFKVFYVNEHGEVKDISSLDPGSEDDDISSWGQLSGLTNRAGKIVAEFVNLYLDR